MGAGTMLLAGLMLAAGALPPEVVPLKERSIQIPIVLNRPQQVRELLLFVSTDQGRTWGQAAYAKPDKQFFPFFAAQDGVYWFQVVTVNQKNEKEPADLNQLKPALVVLVDTQPPVLKISNADTVGGEVALTWRVQDAYPDLDSLRLEYRAAGDPAGAWRPVQVRPLTAGQTRFRPAVNGPVQVRMTVQDLVGNQAQAVQVLGGNAGGVVTAAAPPVPAAGTFAPELPPPPRDVTPPVRSDIGPPPVASSPRPEPRAESPITPVASSSTPPAPRQEVQSTQLVNSTQISLDYEVPRFGPSGIKSVKLYMTRDDGRSWEELADDPDRQSPIQATLPGEGLFGFRLVVESGAGLSRGMPVPGDAPELRIEVDLTSPRIDLFAPAPDPKDRDTLILRWTAEDKNLAPNPIMLEYSTARNGPWYPITAHPIATSPGAFAWKLHQRLPYRVFIRVTAKDLAGNVGEVVSPEPQLIDLTKPEGRLIGIKSANVQFKP